jgi:UDP-N-acetylmuramyl pentapeptide phosphotransferase/UDP-N-acetylglucosamine-1-phosphate transferase
MAGASDQGQAGTAWLVLPVLLLPLILDAAITFTARLISGAPVFQAHRSHLYQRLHRSGWAHGEVSALYMLATAVCAVPALLIHKAPSDGAGLLVASLAVCLGAGTLLHMRAIGFARA